MKNGGPNRPCKNQVRAGILLSVVVLGLLTLIPTPGALTVPPGVGLLTGTQPHRDEEIKCYQVRPGEKIAEIGAGDAAFAHRLLRQEPRIQLWLNDISRSALHKLQWSLRHDPVLRKAQAVLHVVAGNSRSTRLEGLALDKVIIRDAFHHFEHPAAMISSIQRSLQLQGRVFLFERYREECQVNCCPQLLTRTQLLRPWQQQGFRLLAETPIYHQESWWVVIALGRGKL